MKAKMFITTPPNRGYKLEGHVLNRSMREFPNLTDFVDNLGLGYLEASLEGLIECETLDSSQWQMNLKEVMDRIKCELETANPRIIGISINSFQGKNAFGLAKAIKQWDADSIVIAGGYGPTIRPTLFANSPYIDYVGIGEGDRTLPEVVQAIVDKSDIAKVPGLVFTRNKQVITTAKRKLVENLDELPFPKRKPFVKMGEIHGEIVPAFSIIGSKGCYGSCKFCCRDYMQPGYRERSTDSMVEELSQLASRFRINGRVGVIFEDINFMTKPARISGLIEALAAHGLEAYIEGNTRISDIIKGEDMLRKYPKNFVRIWSGAESFNDSFLKRWSKGYTLEDIAKAMRILDEVQIPYRLYTIGADLETKKEEIKHNYDIMFKSGKLQKNFWTKLSEFPTMLMDYKIDPRMTTDKEYGTKHWFFRDARKLFDFDRLRDIFHYPEVAQIGAQLKDDPRYKKLLSKGTDFVDWSYLYSTLGFNPDAIELGEKDERDEEFSKEFKRNPVKAVTKMTNEILDDLEKKVNDVIVKKSLEFIDSDAYSNKEKARILYDLYHILNHSKDGRTEETLRMSRRFIKKAAVLEPEKLLYKWYRAESYRRLNDNGRAKRRELFKDFNIRELEPLMFYHDFADIAVPFFSTDGEKAELMMKAAVEKMPASGSYYQFAWFCAYKEDFDKAFALIDQHLKYCPISSAARYMKALLAKEINRDDIVQRCYQELRQLKGPKKFLEQEIFKEFREKKK
jgi:radical SAM superfamily enzyme YgiQ (UPF0313 family)